MPRAFIPTEHGLKVELLYSQNGQKLENVFNFDCGHNPVLEDVASLAGVVIDWWIAHIQPMASTDLGFMGLKFTNLEAADGFQVEYNTGLPLWGLGEAAGLPGNVTVAVRLNTMYRGRSSTGRVYHVGLRPTQVAGNQLEMNSISVLKAAYEALLSDAQIAGFAWTVISYMISKNWRPAGIKSNITSVSVEQNLDSQRRRLSGRGK